MPVKKMESSFNKKMNNINSKKQKSFEFKIQLNAKNIFLAVIILLFGYLIISAISDTSKLFPERSIYELTKDIKEKKVKKIEVIGTKALVYLKDDTVFNTTFESTQGFISTLKDYNIDPSSIPVTIKDTSTGSSLANILINVVPTILMIAFFIFIFKQARGAQDSIFSFGQNRSKRFNREMAKVTFKDVAGVDEAKKELEEVVDFLKNFEKYKKLGARTPKGILLVGPAGCGKTLLAKAVAGESKVPFYSVAGSEFMEMLVGIGAARVRDLFSNAKKSAPSIIFIDEIDAIGRARSMGVMPSHDEREQTLNQILVEMDGFEPNERVIVIAATNRGDLLDPALLRPGRFDRRIIIDFPDLEGRKSILQIHAKGKPFDKSVSWEKVAKRTVGYSGADLENMLNESAINAARRNDSFINMNDVEEAATKVKLGPEKKRLQSDLDRKITAYHEAGHAIATHFQPNMDPVHRISIVSRGMALGYTLIPPSKDRLHETKTNLIQRIVSMMGGRVAEEVVFDEITTGAANDFDQATRIAKAMVIDYGMSDLGPINYGPTMDVTEWGKSYYEQNTISQEILNKIDLEVKRIIDSAYNKAKSLITEHRKELDKVAEELLRKESIDDEEFLKLVK